MIIIILFTYRYQIIFEIMLACVMTIVLRIKYEWESTSTVFVEKTIFFIPVNN